ncbi:hypothetical protein BEL01nite_69430 [Bradyrhizobium elkanii]|nr:hypothetical protein BEL01nite_69430 [Bradyrhizobium elkanii]
MLPEAMMPKGEGELLIATDGFWADLGPGEQIRFMDEQDVPVAAEGDDRSLLQFRLTGSPRDSDIRGHHDNFYVRST